MIYVDDVNHLYCPRVENGIIIVTSEIGPRDSCDGPLDSQPGVSVNWGMYIGVHEIETLGAGHDMSQMPPGQLQCCEKCPALVVKSGTGGVSQTSSNYNNFKVEFELPKAIKMLRDKL